MSEDVVRVEPEGKRGGEWVTFGLESYRVPPLGFRAVQELAADIESLSKMGKRPTVAQMRVVASIAHAAMARNYPKLTVDEVLDMLDMGNWQRVLSAVLLISGFEKGGAAPGEAVSPPTGPPSTAP
jgi:hypothetical protein